MLGILEYRDKEKRKILDEKVLSYLCKDEQQVEQVSKNKRNREFIRGIAPKSNGNKGRPRKEDIVFYDL